MLQFCQGIRKKSLFDEKHKLSEEEIQDVSDKTMAYLRVKDIASITSWILNADKLRESRIADHMASAIESSMIEELLLNQTIYINIEKP